MNLNPAVWYMCPTKCDSLDFQRRWQSQVLMGKYENLFFIITARSIHLFAAHAICSTESTFRSLRHPRHDGNWSRNIVKYPHRCLSYINGRFERSRSSVETYVLPSTNSLDSSEDLSAPEIGCIPFLEYPKKFHSWRKRVRLILSFEKYVSINVLYHEKRAM